MKKSKFVIITLSLLIALFFSVTSTKAYTEEEKQQAKAWLSAHGYSPTRAGAYQAYEDYKSGKLKLDDEQERTSKKKPKKKVKKKSSKSKKNTKKNTNKTVKNSINRSTTPAPSQTEVPKESKDIVPSTPKATVVSETPVNDKSVKTEKEPEVEQENGHESFSKYIYMGGAVIIVLTIIMFVCIRKTRLRADTNKLE